MNPGDVYTAHRPDGSEWDAVRVVAADRANEALVIVPDDGGFATPEAVDRASFLHYYGLLRAGNVPLAAFETPIEELA